MDFLPSIASYTAACNPKPWEVRLASKYARNRISFPANYKQRFAITWHGIVALEASARQVFKLLSPFSVPAAQLHPVFLFLIPFHDRATLQYLLAAIICILWLYCRQPLPRITTTSHDSDYVLQFRAENPRYSRIHVGVRACDFFFFFLVIICWCSLERPRLLDSSSNGGTRFLQILLPAPFWSLSLRGKKVNRDRSGRNRKQKRKKEKRTTIPTTFYRTLKHLR